SALLVVRCLMLNDGSVRLDLKRLRIKKDKLFKMIQIGVPAGLQGSMFSISNVLIQSSVNSFGSIAMAGNTAGQNLEGFAYTAMNALHQSAVSFTGQNFGARKFKRIGKIALICQGSVFVVGFVISMAIYIFSPWLLQLYSTDPEVIQFGINRLAVICTTYFMCGMMDVMVGILRGMGFSIAPMIVSLTGVCAFRVIWIYTIFAHFRSLQVLYISYPATWTLTFLVQLILFLIVYKRLRKQEKEALA
ncbi:MAG: MATE family efflux transporter, partial [Lachnospiraceae bacterium]|nr:MATE family efflux transporter [Lachnospiraceae bacterium]